MTDPLTNLGNQAAAALNVAAEAAQASIRVVEQLEPPSPVDTYQGGGPELYRAQTVDYQWNYGLLIQPIAGDDASPSVSVGKVCRKTCFKVMRWLVIRAKDKPLLPSSAPLTSNETLTDKKLSLAVPGTFPNGTPLWADMGIYVWIMLVPPGDDDDLNIGCGFVDVAQTTTKNFVVPDQFKAWLTGGGPPVTSDGKLKLEGFPTFTQK